MTDGDFNLEDYERPIEIAEGVFWVGFRDSQSGLQCNPYLIIDGGEAVLIDGGNRPDFSSVMIKILQTGLTPSAIRCLIYHHADPDLCASIPHLEEMIGNRDLTILSHRENNVFIKYYSASVPMLCVEESGMSYTFGNNRVLKFAMTPYAHAAGSFATFDEKTGVLFSSDLFGTSSLDRQLFMDISTDCRECLALDDTCPLYEEKCPLRLLSDFHRRVMPSSTALRYAIQQLRQFPTKIIAPQHGSVISSREDIALLMDFLAQLEDVGIERIKVEKLNEI